MNKRERNNTFFVLLIGQKKRSHIPTLLCLSLSCRTHTTYLFCLKRETKRESVCVRVNDDDEEKKKIPARVSRLGYRDEYLSQTKSAAAQTVRPARRGRTGTFGTAARRAALPREAARVYRPAPDPKTRRSRRRPSCPWGGTS